MTRSARCVLLFLLAAAGNARAAEPGVDALRWWTQCVSTMETRAARDHGEVKTAPDNASRPQVTRVSTPDPGCDVPGSTATLEHWRGTVFIPNVTVDTVLQSLEQVLPVQEDVVAARFVERSPDFVRVQLRLVRRKIITVVLDTEHTTTFERRRPGFAVSRSVMTDVSEIAGAGTSYERIVSPADQRGYLWKMNAYSTYVQSGSNVIVEMETITLSRSVPAWIRPVAATFIESAGREAMTRTLEGIRARFVR